MTSSPSACASATSCSHCASNDASGVGVAVGSGAGAGVVPGSGTGVAVGVGVGGTGVGVGILRSTCREANDEPQNSHNQPELLTSPMQCAHGFPSHFRFPQISRKSRRAIGSVQAARNLTLHALQVNARNFVHACPLGTMCGAGAARGILGRDGDLHRSRRAHDAGGAPHRRVDRRRARAQPRRRPGLRHRARRHPDRVRHHRGRARGRWRRCPGWPTRSRLCPRERWPTGSARNAPWRSRWAAREWRHWSRRRPPNVWVLGVALVLIGILGGLYHPAGLSLITRGVRSRARALGIHGAGGNLGTALAPLADGSRGGRVELAWGVRRIRRAVDHRLDLGVPLAAGRHGREQPTSAPAPARAEPARARWR